MNTNAIYRTEQQEQQERGRAQLRAIQARGLANLHVQLQQQDKVLPAVVSNDGVWEIRNSLRERMGLRLQELLDTIKTMAETAVPWIKKFYNGVLKKYLLTKENMHLLSRVASTTWKGAKSLLGWVMDMWKRSPGICGAVAGAAVGANNIVGLVGFLAALPLLGGFLAGAAATLAISGAAYLGSKVSRWLHDDWFRNELLAGNSQIVEQNVDINDRLAKVEQHLNNHSLRLVS